VLSVGEHPPFQPGDSVLGVAYVSALIAVFNVTLFPLGGYRLVQRDFRSIPPSLPTKMVEEGTQTHPPSLTGHPTQESQVETVVMTEVAGPSRRVGRASLDSATSEYRTRVNTCTSTADLDQLVHLANLGDRGHDSDDDDDNDQNNPRSLMDRRRSLIEEIGFDTRLRTVKSALSLPELTILPEADAHPSEMEVTSTKPASRKRRWLIAIRHFLLTLCSPVNVAVLLGLLVAFIPALKRLFVQTPDMGDREPPLAFLHETASFIGAGSVPLSIANLGAALAKLELRSIHLPSALSLTVLKLIITPIIAVFALDPLLTDVLGWVSTEEDRALRFVLLLAGCVPTATTCLLLTQMYSPDGNAREIAAALVVQYVYTLLR
jgi:predicted permease